MNYVAGFLFEPYMERVVLIQKEKPTWQKGRLNGVGGKMELGETPLQAMQREFREETGLDIPMSQAGVADAPYGFEDRLISYTELNLKNNYAKSL